MAVITFDTLRANKTLRNAGFNEQKAEAIVTVIRESVSEHVATKESIGRVGTRMILAIAGVYIVSSSGIIAALSFILGN